ncbi:hypothetical protein AX17_007037 [Amanita inopinata Kibby_2008]|nr:hypothetical protein AX17_007037 [Amanita inopinata Kibby_2008]
MILNNANSRPSTAASNSGKFKKKFTRAEQKPVSVLRQLLNLIATSVTVIEDACAANQTTIPDLYEPFTPISENFRTSRAVAEAVMVISAAALQLDAILAPPHVSLYHVVSGHFKSAALRVCLESNVTEILREAGPKGMHVDEIGAINGQDPRKLGRFLRLLATHHIYHELRPDVFTNTRISSLLDTLKPTRELILDPESKHDNTTGLPALVSHHLDETFKASAYSWETMQEVQDITSGEPHHSPFARAVGEGEIIYKFYQRPDQTFRRRRFGFAMQGIQVLQPRAAIMSAFDWKSLRPASLVVDISGGIGTSTLELARKFPDLRFVVQDLPEFIQDGKRFWEEKMPKALHRGQVMLEEHDMFEPQTQENVSVFFLKQVLHCWSDEYCVKALKRMRNASKPDTKLVCIESIMPFACHDPSALHDKGIPGSVPREAPPPLLANWGAINEMGYNADIVMFMLQNSQERTILHLDRILRKSGWQIIMVHRQEKGDSNFLQSIEAVPIGIEADYSSLF